MFSDSRKLLAAKRRLKEFQLSKKSYMASNAAKSVSENMERCVSPKSYDVAVNLSNQAHHQTNTAQGNDWEAATDYQRSDIPVPLSKISDSIECDPGNGQDSFDPMLAPPSAQVGTIHDPVENIGMTDIADPPLIVSQEFQSQSKFETKIDHNGDKNQETRIKEDFSASFNNYGSLVGSGALQKECLQQMTSAVENVLTNDVLAGKKEPLGLASDLEERNQFLTACIQEQKDTIDRLQIEINQYKARVSELEVTMRAKEAEYESKFFCELNPLKEQLRLHAQTTGILVGEKAELTAALAQSQATTKQKIGEIEELNAKLKSLQLQLTDSEKGLIAAKNAGEEIKDSFHRLQSSYISTEAKCSQVEQEKDDLELEVAELRQTLNIRNTELVNLQQELKEKIALLALNDLRMQQMTSVSQVINGANEQPHIVAAMEQQVSQLMETLKSVSSERDEASGHYQNYVHQLNAQVTTLALKLEQTLKENSDISSREASLVQRLSELECQVQSQNTIPESLPCTANDDKEKIDRLETIVAKLESELDSLRGTLFEKNLLNDTLKREIDELQELRESNAQASRLASAMEGERLAAARAVSQNHQLKQQLSEMEDAFVQLSNAKLDLTEQLQGERAIGRKLNARLNDTENSIEKLQNELRDKNLLFAELEKEKFEAAQVADQLQHYQAQSQYAGTLQQELHQAQESIDFLTKQNQQLINELNGERTLVQSMDQNQRSTEIECEQTSGIGNDVDKKKVNTLAVMTQTEELNTARDYIDEGITGLDTQSTSTEAVKKLEERFKDTMEQVAELSDEKQRLEHLVLQLQSETETIGEYVTLYQKQRGVLQEKAKEKEEAFRRLLEERNEQQEQLHKLKVLVAQLIRGKSTVTTPTFESEGDDPAENKKLGTEGSDPATVPSESSAKKDSTTSQILDLLTEIKECKDSCGLEPNFHPCSWCSGKLITV
ncbi:golgin subfamily A member 2-like isoform X2 [Athalia rosae]|uniref:golgin subfamily A member 2-like isoform X2 n=1 Tax=Athalia rosae TaxID=37344 RepID=UPI002033F552|nr:golgin subfamily A member 2-like isoform X2 [Athalia rosae]